MDKTLDSFIVWIDRARQREGEFVGSAEFTASSERIRFTSAVELLKFLEQPGPEQDEQLGSKSSQMR